MTTRSVAAPASAGQLLEPATDAVDLGEVAAYALCAQVDPELFFPSPFSPAHDAKTVCALCPVAEACLRWAMAHPVEGVWGGTTAADRERLARAAGGRYYTRTSSPFAGPHALCGTDAARQRHRRAGQTCDRCGVRP